MSKYLSSYGLIIKYVILYFMIFIKIGIQKVVQKNIKCREVAIIFLHLLSRKALQTQLKKPSYNINSY